VAIALLCVVGGLIALAAIPFDLAFEVHARDGRHSRAHLGWLWGRLGVDLRASRATRRKAESPKRRVPWRRIRAGLQSRGFVLELRNLGMRMLRCLHIAELRAAIDVGLDDPADTGTLYGFTEALRAMVSLPSPVEILVRPDFERTDLRLAAVGRVRVVPLEVFVVTLRFLLAVATIRAAIAVARA
jgi:hypothetical protein